MRIEDGKKEKLPIFPEVVEVLKGISAHPYLDMNEVEEIIPILLYKLLENNLITNKQLEEIQEAVWIDGWQPITKAT